jgi:putative tryptophan/tyrosine transport system substrate-binding protein
MKMKLFVLAFCIFFILGDFADLFGQTGKVYKVGISVWTGYPSSVKGFKEAMTAGGLIEGKNVRYVYGKSGLNKEKQREIARRFKKAKVDMVYSLTTPGTTIIKEIMPKTIPIVFSIVTYPADSGLIESFEYSGNNLVGSSNYVKLTNYVKLLKTILPQTKTLAIFHHKKEANSIIQAHNMIRLLKREGIQTIDLEPESVEEMRQMALDIASKVDVFMTTTDTLCQGGGEAELIKISLQKKIPILSSNKIGIENGSTFGPVANFYVLGKISGQMAVKILKENMSPARLQSKMQDTPLILINLKSAEALGIKFSEDQLVNIKYVE